MTIYSETYTKLWGASGKTYLVSTFNTDKVKIYGKYEQVPTLEITLNELTKIFKRDGIVSKLA